MHYQVIRRERSCAVPPAGTFIIRVEFRFIELFVVVHGQTLFLYAPCCACRSSAPLRGALLSCVDKKVTKEATRGGTEVDPFGTPAVSEPFSPDQNRPPRGPSRQELVATLFLIVQYSVKFRFIAPLERLFGIVKSECVGYADDLK